jgi:asparagine synthetase B (glutamine-hydrolysing)
MCGIGGLMLFPKDRTAEELAYIRLLAKNIAVENEVRGHDSTGFAAFSPRGFGLFKHPIRATKLTATTAYEKFMEKSLNQNTKSLLIHTRAGTKGSEKNNLNNHPIETHRYIGIHNGVIYNDDDLFEQLKLFRAAEVDSEIIFRLLDSVGDKPDANGLKWVAEKLQGAFTTAFVPKKERSKLYLIRNDNPVTLVYIHQLNVIAFASQKDFLVEAIKEADEYTSISIDQENECAWVHPGRQTIWSFDMNIDNALEQLSQEPAKFTENWSYGYSRRWFGYYDGYDYDDNFFRRGAAEIAPEQEAEAQKVTLASILTKLSSEELEFFDKYVDAKESCAWSEGWTKGRESLGEEMEHKIGIAFEEGYNKGFNDGFEDGCLWVQEDKQPKEAPQLI